MNRLRPFGPAMTAPRPGDALRAACGAALGLLACEALLHLLSPASAPGQLLLIAPFGATAFLIFVVPNSPLAQPWSAIIGNTVAAAAALLVLLLNLGPLVTALIATVLAILAMALLRAFHPPAGAVVMATILAAADPAFPGAAFLLSPVLAGTTALVGAGLLWHRVSGRTYPFRQPPAATSPTPTPLPAQGLAALLDRLRLTPNIGVGDLARLLSETDAAAHPLANLTAARMMTHDPVTATPGTALPELARLFRSHGFKTLPITDAQGRYLGLIAQSALLGLTDATTTAAALATLVPSAPPEATAQQVLHHLAAGQAQAVPVVHDGRLIGLITRTDVITRLAQGLHGT
jgi:CBS domain-containing membrane protein